MDTNVQAFGMLRASNESGVDVDGLGANIQYTEFQRHLALHIICQRVLIFRVKNSSLDHVDPSGTQAKNTIVYVGRNWTHSKFEVGY